MFEVENAETSPLHEEVNEHRASVGLSVSRLVGPCCTVKDFNVAESTSSSSPVAILAAATNSDSTGWFHDRIEVKPVAH
jgi:hypothetical protein